VRRERPRRRGRGILRPRATTATSTAAGGRGGVKALGAALSPPASALALLGDDRVAALCGDELVILARKGRPRAPAPAARRSAGTAIASDPSRAWIAVGGERGVLFAFDGEAAKVGRERASVGCTRGRSSRCSSSPRSCASLSGGGRRPDLPHPRPRRPRSRGSQRQEQPTPPRSPAWSMGQVTRPTPAARDGVARVWTRGSGRPSNPQGRRRSTSSPRRWPSTAAARTSRSPVKTGRSASSSSTPPASPSSARLTLHGAVAWARRGARPPRPQGPRGGAQGARPSGATASAIRTSSARAPRATATTASSSSRPSCSARAASPARPRRQRVRGVAAPRVARDRGRARG
jgi:hypothetical protein